MNTETLKIIGIAAVALWFIIAGRLFCGKACPLGFVQDLLFKIPFAVKIKSFKADKLFRFLKYAHLVYNFALPAIAAFGIFQFVVRDEFELPVYITIALIAVIIQRPFCKYWCAIGAAGSLFNNFASKF